MVWVDVFIAISFIFMAVIDLKSRYIYDVHVVITGLLICVRLLGNNYFSHFFGAGVGFLIGYLMYKLAYFYYREEAFGFGDVLLLMLIGLYFGWPIFLHYFAVCYMLIGLVIIIPVILRPKLLRESVPMAPFYIFGAFAYRCLGSPKCLEFVSRILEYIG